MTGEARTRLFWTFAPPLAAAALGPFVGLPGVGDVEGALGAPGAILTSACSRSGCSPS